MEFGFEQGETEIRDSYNKPIYGVCRVARAMERVSGVERKGLEAGRGGAIFNRVVGRASVRSEIWGKTKLANQDIWGRDSGQRDELEQRPCAAEARTPQGFGRGKEGAGGENSCIADSGRKRKVV